jgi:thioredoxin reductase
MTDKSFFDVIIIGGSYAGLSAAMALGRSLRNVLIIDSGQPCNIQTPHSHNFLTQDGVDPKTIAAQAKDQVLKYDTIRSFNGKAVSGKKSGNVFSIQTETGETFESKKMLFATGVVDILPDIKGLKECWGISVLHCPYCHGYEVKNSQIGLLGNGDLGFELSRLINNWTKNLVLFTNEISTLTDEQRNKILQHNIRIIEAEISHLEHQNGKIKKVVLKNGNIEELNALFARGTFKQHCEIPITLGCELTEQGYIKIDDFQKTSVKGIYAAGDNTTMYRAVSAAIAAGNKAGAFINKELIDEEF